MIGNKLFYNNIIQTSHGAGTIVVQYMLSLLLQLFCTDHGLYSMQGLSEPVCPGCMADAIVTAVMSRSAYNMYSNLKLTYICA